MYLITLALTTLAAIMVYSTYGANAVEYHSKHEMDCFLFCIYLKGRDLLLLK